MTTHSKQTLFLLFLIVSFPYFFTVDAQVVEDYKIYKRKNYKRADSLRGALRPERTCFDVYYYDLTVRIPEKKGEIEGQNLIHFRIKEPTNRIQIDLFDNMEIGSITTLENTDLKYEREKNAIFIDFPNTLQVNDLQIVKIVYNGKPKINQGTYGDTGFHWDKDRQGRPWYGVTCEQVGASLWWPNKDHLSDEPDSMRIHLQVPSDLYCISNGILENSELVGQETIYHWFVQNPIDNYNVTFYLGNYIRTIIPYNYLDKEKEIEIYTLDYTSDRIEEYFLFVPEMIGFFEEVYGDYPFWNDKFAIVQSSYRGMEHQSCLAIGKSLTISNWYYTYGIPWHSTLIHEIAHEWWGNSISISDMADAWLQEGLATYSEMLFIEAAYGIERYNASIEQLKKYIEYEYPVVGNRDVNDNTFSNGDIYQRGACIVHELREEIGKENLLKVLFTFQQTYKKKTVTTQDFINTVNEVTGNDYTKFLMDKLYKK